MRTTSGARVRGGLTQVSSRSDRQRVLLGVHVTAQAVLIVIAALVLTSFVGLAVLSWLERTA